MSYSCCWSEFVGVSAALTPAAATSAAGAAPTRAAAPDTVSTNTSTQTLGFSVLNKYDFFFLKV